MIEVKIAEEALRESASRGMAAFFETVLKAVNDAVGGNITAETMARMNADQITLLAYGILREEVLSGGFIQLIHNGYGAFIFVNPFAKAVRAWGLEGLAGLINKAHKLYNKFHKELERDLTDEEFMALYEQYPAFDALDDMFVDLEERFTAQVAVYIDEHPDGFFTV
ncbi:MAG: DMP19 family protein [Prevotella sp.]|nr:DMP19 family protein [Prevotella sp.]